MARNPLEQPNNRHQSYHRMGSKDDYFAQCNDNLALQGRDDIRWISDKSGNYHLANPYNWSRQHAINDKAAKERERQDWIRNYRNPKPISQK
jgi:hypothetical protein